MRHALFPPTLALALALGGTVPPAVAALDEPAAPPPAVAAQPLTRAAASALAADTFARLDVNHDGKLDAADRAAERDLRLKAHFDAIDTNHDGMISREEFAAAHHHAMDRDGDGPPPKVGEGPLPPPPGVALGYDAPGAPVHRHPPMHAGEGPGMRRDLPLHPMMIGLILRTADPQHTNTVSQQAFVAAALQLFDRADLNHDGTLSPDEIRAAHLRHTAARPIPPAWHPEGGGPDAEPDDAPPPPHV